MGEKAYYSGHKELVEFSSNIKDSKLYKVCSNLYASDREINDIVSNLHKTQRMGQVGPDELERRIWTIFWINPYIAIKIIESCTLSDQIDLYGALKSVYYGMLDKSGFMNGLSEYILNNKMDFTILLVEICYSDAVQNGHNQVFCNALLNYAYKAHDPSRGAYLSARNLQHIYYHIPDKRKIDFLNWFWEKYRYEKQQNRVNHYGKATTEKPERCLNIILEEVKNDYLWKYYEKDEEVSDNTKDAYRSFIASVMAEAEHKEFLEIVFGRDNLEDKIQRVLGNGEHGKS